MCTLFREEEGLGQIDIRAKGIVLVTKWVVWAMTGNAPWKMLILHLLLMLFMLTENRTALADMT
jgi:hypothetical protein